MLIRNVPNLISFLNLLINWEGSQRAIFTET